MPCWFGIKFVFARMTSLLLEEYSPELTESTRCISRGAQTKVATQSIISSSVRYRVITSLLFAAAFPCMFLNSCHPGNTQSTYS